jgi:hypothetical protein
MITTRRARIIREAIIDALSPHKHWEPSPPGGLYGITYNRVRAEQDRRYRAATLRGTGRRNPKRNLTYRPNAQEPTP